MESEIRSAIQKVLGELQIMHADFSVEHPTDVTHGDYATNVALVCSKEAGKSPREIAEQFRASLEGTIPHVKKIEIAGPGFINFYLTRDFFGEKIAEVISQGNTWGTNDSLRGEEIIFEYTSPNLFKPLHVGNLVGNIIGESVSRLFEAGGAIVHRVNYPSDIGLTVAKGVWGLKKTKGSARDIVQIGEAYRVGNEAYENDPVAKLEIESTNRALYAETDSELNTLRNEGLATSRLHLATLCKKLGTTFDLEITESNASPTGVEIVRSQTGTVFEESEGAVIFRGEKYGLHTRVFLNSQGLPTYEAKDLGNFVLKRNQYPSWTQYFVVTGNEQREYFKVIFAVIKEIFTEAQSKVIEHIPTGFLTLTTGKMSSRKGNVLTGESLIADVEEVAKAKAVESRAENIDELSEILAVSALKYQILRQSVGSDIVFDKERALSLEGDSGPYLEYTHARIVSIREKAREAGIVPSTHLAPESVYEVEKIVYHFPEIVHKAQRERAPHHLITYLTTLAGSFNTFYAHEKIVDATDVLAPYKLALTSAVGQTLNTGLTLLGITPVEKM